MSEIFLQAYKLQMTLIPLKFNAGMVQIKAQYVVGDLNILRVINILFSISIYGIMFHIDIGRFFPRYIYDVKKTQTLIFCG